MPTFRVICIGDTLVKGQDSTFGGARTFRGSLQTLLTTNNYLINFLGRVADVPAAGGADPDHEGYAGALIGTAFSGANITAMAAANPTIEAVVVLVGWEDVLANTANIGTVYGTMVTNIQAAWSGVACFLCTLPPYYNKTEAETVTAYAAYGTLNTAIRALAGTNKYIVDLAAMGGAATSERTAFVETLISETKKVSDHLINVTGGAISDPYAGARYLDFQGIADRAEQSIPPGTGRPTWGGSDFASYSNQSWFPNNVSQIYTWTHAWLAPGHTATNTGVEFRNVCVMCLQTNGTWVEMIVGARVQGAFWFNDQWLDQYTTPAGCSFRQQPDGISTFWRAASNTGWSPEAWPIDRSPPIGPPMYQGTYPGVNRSAIANATAFLVTFQARLMLDDPNGPNDINNARYLIRTGFDMQTVNSAGDRIGPDGNRPPRYDTYGFPLGANDNGGGRNAVITGSELQTFGFITMQGQGLIPGFERPWYTTWVPSPQGQAPYGRTEAQIRANPPPLPTRWTYTQPLTGFPTSDYAGTTYPLAQSGADRISQRMYEVMLASGELVGFTDTGGPTPQPAAGISTRPVYADLQTSSLYTYSDTESSAAPQPPVWITTDLPAAVVGVAYSVTAQAGGVPAATYSIVSGAPGWLSINSTSGALTGTPTGGETSHTLVLRATNTIGGVTKNVDIALLLEVKIAAVITTTTLPAAVIGVPYFQSLAATSGTTGAWSVTTGALPAGLVLSAGGVISGTATGTTQTFTVTYSTGFGTPDTQVLTLTVSSAAGVPVITTTALADGVVGLAYSQTLAATSTGPSATWTRVAGTLPPGLSLNGSTGAITGTPTSAGGFGATFAASNGNGTPPTITLTINIAAAGATSGASPWTTWMRRR